MTIANSAAVPAPVLENPWSWKDIRIQPGHQHRYAIVMEGASDVGCEKIINATLPHFPVITVNGLRVSDNQQIRRTCSASMNTLTFVVTAHR